MHILLKKHWNSSVNVTFCKEIILGVFFFLRGLGGEGEVAEGCEGREGNFPGI